MIGAGAILAFYELQRWFATKRWIHVASIVMAVIMANEIPVWVTAAVDVTSVESIINCTLDNWMPEASE